jgi:hypothetical protein
MNFVIRTALTLVIRWVVDNQLTSNQIELIKGRIKELEGRAIDGAIKHEIAASIVKRFAENLSNTAIDTVVKLLLLVVRSNA